MISSLYRRAIRPTAWTAIRKTEFRNRPELSNPGRVVRRLVERSPTRAPSRPQEMLTDAAPTGQDPPHVRARRADRHHHLLRGADRGVPGARHAQLLGRILRRPGRAAGTGTGRGGACGVLQ